jgi:hypothetical protein
MGMRLLVIIIKSVLFYLLGIVFWFCGTVFHGFLWWMLGIPQMPAFIPYMNLLFIPCAFWLSFQLILHPQGLICTRCNEVGRRPLETIPSLVIAEPSSIKSATN